MYTTEVTNKKVFKDGELSMFLSSKYPKYNVSGMDTYRYSFPFLLCLLRSPWKIYSKQKNSAFPNLASLCILNGAAIKPRVLTSNGMHNLRVPGSTDRPPTRSPNQDNTKPHSGENTSLYWKWTVRLIKKQSRQKTPPHDTFFPNRLRCRDEGRVRGSHIHTHIMILIKLITHIKCYMVNIMF